MEPSFEDTEDTTNRLRLLLGKSLASIVLYARGNTIEEKKQSMSGKTMAPDIEGRELGPLEIHFHSNEEAKEVARLLNIKYAEILKENTQNDLWNASVNTDNGQPRVKIGEPLRNLFATDFLGKSCPILKRVWLDYEDVNVSARLRHMQSIIESFHNAGLSQDADQAIERI